MIVGLPRAAFAVSVQHVRLSVEKAKGGAMSAADRRIVVLNTGSSSLKFAVYPMEPEAPPLLSGEVDGIGGSAHLKITGADGRTTHDAR